MLKRLFFTTLTVILAGHFCVAHALQQSAISSTPESEEYAVYTVLVNSILDRVAANVVYLDIVTLSDEGESQRLLLVEEASTAEVLGDYVTKNTRSYLLEQKPASRRRLLLPSKGKLPKSCPCLNLALSRVGFDGAKTTALIRVRYGLGVLPKDHYVVLKKDEAGWKIVRKIVRLVQL